MPHLGERSRRLLCGAVAGALGHGGVTRVAELAEVSVPTVIRGARELDDPPDPYGRTRRAGGGPKRAVERQRGLLQALDRLVDPDTRGDPTSPLRWTCKSTRHLAEVLGAQGFQVSDDTIGRLLREQATGCSAPARRWRAPSTPT
ncbi:MAG TPA: ISAzo13 family transposase, partial [Actinomycetes bacterium]|nr:ISAzo13 family transposase [Actinomycetes bacterium]